MARSPRVYSPVSDYWKHGEEVSLEKVLHTMKQNAENVKHIILDAVGKICDSEDDCTTQWKVSRM